MSALVASTVTSKHFGSRQLIGLCKIGDVLVCGDSDLPSFSQSGQIAHLDRILDYISPQDLVDMKLLLWLFSWMPQWMLQFFWVIVDSSNNWPSWFGATLRLVRLGIRGVVFSLYYFEGKAQAAMGYNVSVYTDDLKE